MPWEIKMAREFLVHEGSVHSEAGSLLGSSEAFLLLCMIVVSLSIISMVIFACGDSNSGGGSLADCFELIRDSSCMLGTCKEISEMIWT
ncbi:hypothetical protein DKX38_017113 [Salix brachista]|uniref:Uncharacterized protein n=1 Tax=Salix brachista TaxID=2182728 RepID=A0A5N5KUD2_9ROSI|nr:hypothetical protein DKX38_017113 [Salix brachista]